MKRRVAKELLHIDTWIERAEAITLKGRTTYLEDGLLQEAGDSLMMKLGEACTRLVRMGVAPPAGTSWRDVIANRNFLIHQYDLIDREMTWETVAHDLPTLHARLAPLIHEARALINPVPND